MSMAYFADPDTGATAVPFHVGPIAKRPDVGLPLVLATMRDLREPTAAEIAARCGLSVRQTRRMLARARSAGCAYCVVRERKRRGIPVYALTPAGFRVARGEP